MKTIWSFDLGKASIGEAVRNLENHSFPHKASLLIPEDFAETQTAASRRRMKRTRDAHKAREAWLDAVWCAAGLTPLVGRRVEKRDGKWQPVAETQEQTKQRELLEREFPKKGDSTCYNSALLRIKLLNGEKLEAWQIYKALHSAVQKRGYGRVPWAAREVGKKQLSPDDLEKELKRQDDEMAKKDPAYKAAVEAWPAFKGEVPEKFHYPCYYDAAKMGLWNSAAPDALADRIDCTAKSTRRVRFAREDVEKEITLLARNAATQLPELKNAFTRWQCTGCSIEWSEKPLRAEIGFGKAKSSKGARAFDVKADNFGAFLVHGPAGMPDEKAKNDFAAYLDFRTRHGIHPGSTDDWMGATAQKTPRFDNRIINECALLEGHQVCNVTVRYDAKNKRPFADSLLASEVTFLMKLKNTLVEGMNGQRKLTVEEIRKIFAFVSDKAATKGDDLKDYSASVIKCYALNESAWGSTKGIKELGLRPLKGHEVIKPPKVEGRSRFSRPALRLIRALVLSGNNPGEFHRRLCEGDAALFEEMGMDVRKEPLPPRQKINGKAESQRRPYVLTSQLKFLTDLARTNDTWDAIHIPEQRLDALEARHTNDGQLQSETAIRDLIARINDPVVRYRLGVFASRLGELHTRFGVPEEIVIEFIRTDFMGPKAKAELAAFQKKREQARSTAKEQVGKADALKFELAAAQGFCCLYCGHPLEATKLGNYEIEHIVPRSQNGPDAMVNYVLAHRECNIAKGDRTPFEWLRQSDGWDAYIKRVESRATDLRNKKIQLLQREDAAELVQRYTALAETAWISRLAQKVASLHFGWRNGIDDAGCKRVTVISGGLTARVRRKYQLNCILAPCPAGEDPAEWESKAEKNRKDDRHHALDAMVINFLPQWSRDARKEHFFRFPDPIQKNAKAFFRKEIDEVMPRNVAFEKPKLAETIYGGRRDGEATVIVQRVPLFALGMKPASQGKSVFDPKYLCKKAKSVREPLIAEAIRQFLAEGHDEEAAWKDFCQNLYLPRPNGSRGPRVLKVNVTAGAADEYAEMSKDQTGAFRKGKKGHRGQIVYLLRTTTKKGAVKETIEVRPVYVFESCSAVEKKLNDEYGDALTIYDFFQSGCLIAVEEDVAHEKKRLPAGTYLLNTIIADSKCIKLTTQDGKTYPEIPLYSLASLIAAGLRRAD